MELFHAVWQGAPRWFRRTANRWALLPGSFSLSALLATPDPLAALAAAGAEPHSGAPQKLLGPVEDQEIWACGVTYFNSRRARMTESTQSGDCYDRVYSASRPQIFPKARGRNVIGSGAPLLLRKDSDWIVPEAELVLVLSSSGSIIGATLGNDLSCRDIEGANPLYQPQAKIWRSSCTLGPCIELTRDIASLAAREIRVEITRGGGTVFEGQSSTRQLTRPLPELAATLFSYREFPDGAFLFTGTGIVPPDDFRLKPTDVVRMSLEGVGELENPVTDAAPGFEIPRRVG